MASPKKKERNFACRLAPAPAVSIHGGGELVSAEKARISSGL